MPKIDLNALPPTNVTSYPAQFAGEVKDRWFRRLAPAAGLTHFGASHVVLKPGAWSSQRHWHDSEDELLVMLSGEAVLAEDDGETLLRAGDICAWPQGTTNGHHLRNESDADCTFVVVSGGTRTGGGYSDIDMRFTSDSYVHKDGTPYAEKLPR